MLATRKIEVLSAGCAVCEDTITLINRIACPSCEVEILDMRDAAVAKRAKAYGVRSVPAIIVDGRLADGHTNCSRRHPGGIGNCQILATAVDPAGLDRALAIGADDHVPGRLAVHVLLHAEFEAGEQDEEHDQGFHDDTLCPIRNTLGATVGRHGEERVKGRDSGTRSPR